MLIMTATESPQKIYTAALRERKSKDPLKRREACEKGWLAVMEAVDEFLTSKGRVIPKGTADSHVKRNAALADLADKDQSLVSLKQMVSDIVDSLDGACFCGNQESPYYDKLLKKTVRDVLEKTGHPVNDLIE
jgi:hypothetical protein